MEDLKWSSVFFIIISNNFMEEKCICSVQIWKEVFDYFDREPKKIEINENYSIDEDAKETLQEKRKRMLVREAKPIGNMTGSDLTEQIEMEI